MAAPSNFLPSRASRNLRFRKTSWMRSMGNPPPFRMNQFGGSIGGPVVLPHYNGKDKTFFFFNYEGQRQRQSNTTLNIVPTLAERQGDLSAISTTIYDPYSGNTATGLRTPFPNNQIPLNRIDP